VVFHKAKKGETLGMLATRYGTTVHAIQHENGLRRSITIQARRIYRIPVSRPAAPARLPARMQRAPEPLETIGARQTPESEIPSPP
jgi:LysM repeat protein